MRTRKRPQLTTKDYRISRVKEFDTDAGLIKGSICNCKTKL